MDAFKKTVHDMKECYEKLVTCMDQRDKQFTALWLILKRKMKINHETKVKQLKLHLYQ